jgi:hypothetical protein
MVAPYKIVEVTLGFAEYTKYLYAIASNIQCSFMIVSFSHN